MAPLADELGTLLDDIAPQRPTVPFYSTVLRRPARRPDLRRRPTGPPTCAARCARSTPRPRSSRTATGSFRRSRPHPVAKYPVTATLDAPRGRRPVGPADAAPRAGRRCRTRRRDRRAALRGPPRRLDEPVRRRAGRPPAHRVEPAAPPHRPGGRPAELAAWTRPAAVARPPAREPLQPRRPRRRARHPRRAARGPLAVGPPGAGARTTSSPSCGPCCACAHAGSTPRRGSPTSAWTPCTRCACATTCRARWASRSRWTRSGATPRLVSWARSWPPQPSRDDGAASRHRRRGRPASATPRTGSRGSSTCPPAGFTTCAGASAGLPPAVLLHANSASAASWARVGPALADRFEVFALDLRGHGASAGAGSYGLRAAADDVVDFFDALGLDRPLLVGHSWGAAVALVLASGAQSARPRAASGRARARGPAAVACAPPPSPTGCRACSRRSR